MAFFNSKEEVFDIELTQYGKLLLSRGLFKPAFYSFHDDDILYDAQYASVEENSNFAEVRIQEETPTHKTFYSIKGTKPNIDFDFDQENFRTQRAKLAQKKPNLRNSNLSNSTISNLYVPSWEIYNLSHFFTSSTNTYSTSNFISSSIPQFEVEIPITFYKTNQEQIDNNTDLQTLAVLEQVTYDNDSILIFVNKPLIMKIIENNNDFDYDAFEMEIYKITKDEDDNDVFEQLKFLKNQENYDSETDLYVATNNSLLQLEQVDSSYAEHYFEILTDKEIGNENVCRYVLKSSEDQDNIFDDITVCEDLRTKFNTDSLYNNLPDIATGKNC